MACTSFVLPEVVDLASARSVAADLLRHVRDSPSPSVDAAPLRQAGVPLLQILVAAQRHASALGKPFAVELAPDGALSALLSTHGLDPRLCGVAALPLPLASLSTERG